MVRKLQLLRKCSRILIFAESRVQREKLFLRVSWSTWLYPMMIMLSSVAAALAIFVFSDTVMHPILSMWFLFICPGMTVVHFFQLDEVVIEWLLALALSIVIDVLIAGIILYAGWWSPIHIFMIVISFCIIGAMMQLVVIYRKMKDPIKVTAALS